MGVSGVGDGPAHGVEVAGSGPSAVERAVRSCRLSPWTHSPLALSPQHGDNEKVGPLGSTPSR